MSELFCARKTLVSETDDKVSKDEVQPTMLLQKEMNLTLYPDF